MALLSVKNLRVVFPLRSGAVEAIQDVSFELEEGERIGIVGESGAGKSVSAFAILNLIAKPGYLAAGSILFQGQDLVQLNESELRHIRGNRISMIFQDPMMTLNPVLRIDTQMIEAIRAHEKISYKQAWVRARDGLDQVGIPSPEQRLRNYPHQLSGGMRQRVAIAIAFLNNPELLIADEPTTALDVTIQAQIVHIAQKLCRERGTALIWIILSIIRVILIPLGCWVPYPPPINADNDSLKFLV